MTRRTPKQYDFRKQLFDEMLLPTSGPGRRASSRNGSRVKHIDIHHMTIHDTNDGGALRACVQTWKTRPASAHYGVDRDRVAQFVYDNLMAWGNANGQANREGIVIEHANSTVGDAAGWKIAEITFETSAKLVAGLHITHKLGRPRSGGFGTSGTIRTHQSFYATACPGPYFKKNWKRYVKMCQRAYDEMTGKVQPRRRYEAKFDGVKAYDNGGPNKKVLKVLKRGSRFWVIKEKDGWLITILGKRIKASDAQRV